MTSQEEGRRPLIFPGDSRHRIVKKVWGEEEWVINAPADPEGRGGYCGKILRLTPGFRCSLHYHPVKHETFYVLKGRVLLELRAQPTTSTYLVQMRPGDSQVIRPGIPHRFSAEGGTGATIIEFSTTHDDADVVRLEESGCCEVRSEEHNDGR